MSEHTKGPWEWSGPTEDGHNHKRAIAAKTLPGVVFSRELVSGQQWVMESGVDFGSGPFDLVIATEADARLIAAAPTLLEACKTAELAIDLAGSACADTETDKRCGECTGCLLHAALTMSRAAIKLAEGHS